VPLERNEPGDEDATESVRQLPDTVGLRIVISTPAGVTSVALPHQEVVRIGRAPECEIVVANESVSRVHAIIRDGSPPTLEDAGSRHGTLLFGRKLAEAERAPLTLGAIFKLGAATLLFQRARGAVPAGEVRHQAAESSTPPPDSDEPVVASPRMRELYGMLEVVAPSPLAVLVLGETGSGKEVFARAIHERSLRKGQFVAINCAAIPDALLESELFGHERGAFTGALQAKKGLFESADGGTLFLDEVGELPPPTQAKLLRVLDTGEITRLGSLKPLRVDVRVVSATNRDLTTPVDDRRFREDLLFRLDGITITLPPLRERVQDIAPLARRFARSVGRAGHPAATLASDAIAYLEAQPWRGNIRELRHLVMRAVTLNPEVPELRASHLQALPAHASGPSSLGTPLAAPTSAPSASTTSQLRTSLDTLERDRILEALRQTSGNQTEAAKLLGIGRRTLLTKLDRHAIQRPRKGAPGG
jgi:two-component system response regulator AtoC